jgi:hypothetical protein
MRSKSWRFHVGILLVASLSLLTACDLALSGEASVDIQATLASIDSKALPQSKGASVSVNLSPTKYKMAITYFALVKDDGTEVIVTERDDSDPLLVDFTDKTPGTLIGVFEGARLPRGTYTKYRIRFQYMEMTYPAAFHVPAVSADATEVNTLTSGDYTFRQYFNTIAPFWKRDFVVRKPVSSGAVLVDWYWMRRAFDAETDSFFIRTDSSHPTVGVIDLFNNEDFWGAAEDYDDPSVKITIESGDTTGGLDATMEEFTLKVDTVLLLEVDTSECMNYWEFQPAAEAVTPAGVTLSDDIMDLGPTYDADPVGAGPIDNYGDSGIHPFMPKFKMKVHVK